MLARLPEKGLSSRRGLYVSTVVPLRMMAFVSRQDESSTTTNSVPGRKHKQVKQIDGVKHSVYNAVVYKYFNTQHVLRTAAAAHNDF